MTGTKIGSLLLEEFKEILPPTLFFMVGFILTEGTTQLILDNYLVRFANYHFNVKLECQARPLPERE
jgi:hypothetical protein